MKQCKKCKTMNDLENTKCTNCGHRFIVNCKGCGCDTLGRDYCKECITPGVYLWQKN